MSFVQDQVSFWMKAKSDAFPYGRVIQVWVSKFVSHSYQLPFEPSARYQTPLHVSMSSRTRIDYGDVNLNRGANEAFNKLLQRHHIQLNIGRCSTLSLSIENDAEATSFFPAVCIRKRNLSLICSPRKVSLAFVDANGWKACYDRSHEWESVGHVNILLQKFQTHFETIQGVWNCCLETFLMRSHALAGQFWKP